MIIPDYNVLNALDSHIRVLNVLFILCQLGKRDNKIKFYIPIILPLLRSLPICIQLNQQKIIVTFIQ